MGNRESLDKYFKKIDDNADHMGDEEKERAMREILEKAQSSVIDFVNPYSAREAPVLAAAMMIVADAIKESMNTTEKALTLDVYQAMKECFFTGYEPHREQVNE